MVKLPKQMIRPAVRVKAIKMHMLHRARFLLKAVQMCKLTENEVTSIRRMLADCVLEPASDRHRARV